MRPAFATLVFHSDTRFRIPRKKKRDMKKSYLALIGKMAAHAHPERAPRLLKFARNLKVRVTFERAL